MKKKQNDDMRPEYDFSNAKKGKFYHPVEDIEILIYLEKHIKEYYYQIAKNKKSNVSTLINRILKKEMDLQKELNLK